MACGSEVKKGLLRKRDGEARMGDRAAATGLTLRNGFLVLQVPLEINVPKPGKPNLVALRVLSVRGWIAELRG